MKIFRLILFFLFLCGLFFYARGSVFAAACSYSSATKGWTCSDTQCTPGNQKNPESPNPAVYDTCICNPDNVSRWCYKNTSACANAFSCTGECNDCNLFSGQCFSNDNLCWINKSGVTVDSTQWARCQSGSCIDPVFETAQCHNGVNPGYREQCLNACNSNYPKDWGQKDCGAGGRCCGTTFACSGYDAIQGVTHYCDLPSNPGGGTSSNRNPYTQCQVSPVSGKNTCYYASGTNTQCSRCSSTYQYVWTTWTEGDSNCDRSNVIGATNYSLASPCSLCSPSSTGATQPSSNVGVNSSSCTNCTLPWGGTISTGQSVTAYQASSVACGSSCVSQTRTCNNGTLSGSYTRQTCSVSPCPCNLPWGGTINSGQSVTAYLSSSAACGSSCVSQTRTCNNGTLSGSYTRQTCSVSPCPCNLPWGGTINSGQSVTAYQASSVACGFSCVSQTRVCNNGTLSGSYTKQTCSVASCSDCVLPWGGILTNGQSVTAYLSSSVACGGSCTPQTRTCNNGALSGSYQFDTCSVQACTFTISGTVYIDTNENGVKDVTESAYQSATVTVGGVGTSSNVSGLYSRTGLAAGTYGVVLSVPPDYEMSAAEVSNSKSATVGPNATVNFGIVPVPTEVPPGATYDVDGYVFVDENKSGVRDGAEVCYDGAVRISINGGAGQNFASTPACNTYSFTSAVSPYTVSIVSIPAGYAASGWNGSDSLGPKSGNGNTTSSLTGDATINFGINNSGSWIQTVGGDWRNDGGVNNPIPAGASCSPYASLRGDGGTPGIIFSGGNDYNFAPGAASETDPILGFDWAVGGSTYPDIFNTRVGRKTSYDYLYSKAIQSGITPTDISPYCGGDIADCNLTPLPNGVFIASGNLTLKGAGYTFDSNKNFVILVDGDLRLEEKILVPLGSTVIFSSSQDIIVDRAMGEAYNSDVSDLEGMYSADRNFIVDGYNDCAVQTDNRLNVSGNIVSNASLEGGSVQNRRDLCAGNSDCPAIYIKERPDFILYAPEFIKNSRFTWQELAP